jgi:hypothetical protein
MTYVHGYSISDVEGMIPYERDIFASMIKARNEEESS